MIAFTLVAFTTVFGTLILASRNLEFLHVFLIVGYLGIVASLLRAARHSKDILNPLCLFLGICFIRYSLPAYLVSQGDVHIAFFDVVGYQQSDWQLGHVLGMTGWSALALGWSLIPGRWKIDTSLKVRVPQTVAYASVAGMLFGLFFLIAFIRSNGGMLAFIVNGTFRGIEVQEGTGIFFHLSMSLIASSVVLAAYFLGNSQPKWRVFMPITIAMLAFWILGGRGRALTPFMSGLLLMWYVTREEEKWCRMPPVRYLMGLLGIPVVLWMAHFGILYRGLGLAALSRSIFDLWEYVKYAVFVDIGQLQSLAGAVRVEAGGLEGKSFIGLLWPLSAYLELPGRSAGPWMAEQLLGGFTDRKWGINPTLIGDAYLNFGVLGVPVIMGLLGMVVKSIYFRFRQGQVHGVTYALVIGWGFHIFFGSVSKWGPLMLTLVSSFTLFFVGRTLADFEYPRRTFNQSIDT